MSNDSAESHGTTDQEEQDVCPVCGQEFVHKRERTTGESYDLRDDYVQCRRYETLGVNASDTVWVHEAEQTVNTNTTVVKHVDRDPFVSGGRKLGNRDLLQQDLESQQLGNSEAGGSRTSGDLSGSQPGDFS